MEQQIVKDKHGNILYRVERYGNELKVKDKHGKILGSCRNGKTYDAKGGIVAHGETPGLLYNGD